jgi:hypothetical protein
MNLQPRNVHLENELTRNLLGSEVKIADLIKRRNKSTNVIKVMVFRSMPFEPMEVAINAFLTLSNIRAEFSYSNYDLALSEVQSYEGDHDLIIIWNDWRLLESVQTSIPSWLTEVISKLRLVSSSPILLNNWPVSCEAFANVEGKMVGKRRLYSELDMGLGQICDNQTDIHLLDLETLVGKRCLGLEALPKCLISI